MRGKRIIALIGVAMLSMGADGGCDPKGDPTATAPAPAPADPKPEKEEDKTVLMTVVWTKKPGTWQQVQYWENAEPSKVFRPSNGRWVHEIQVAPGTPVVLKGIMRSEGEMSCLLQVVDGEQNRDYRSGPGNVQCKVYA